MKRAFQIIHEDDYLLVVNKKAGVLAIPDRYQPDKLNLYDLLINYRGEIYPLHRLDKNTSGIMVYAKDATTQRFLSEQFQNRTIEKQYLAVVDGNPYPSENTIETLLSSSANQKYISVVEKKGKTAITQYKVIEEYQDYSLLEVKIQTGRQHQIRVHLKHIGHPLAVDKKYGYREAIYAYEIKKKNFRPNRQDEVRPLISRHSLHAQKLTITHPQHQERISFTAPIPKDMKALINQLRKWRSKS